MVKVLKSALVMLVMVLLLSLGPAWAKEKPTVMVLPFSVSGAENIDYIQQGVWEVLISRIAADNKIEVTSKDFVLTNLKEPVKKDLTLADIYGLGKKMNVDFVVWGSIAKIGNNVSIDGKLVDVNAYQSSVGIFVQPQSLDEIIPQISDYAQRISRHITGDASAPAAALPPAYVRQQLSPQAIHEGKIIAGMKASKKGTFTSIPFTPEIAKPAQEK